MCTLPLDLLSFRIYSPGFILHRIILILDSVITNISKINPELLGKQGGRGCQPRELNLLSPGGACTARGSRSGVGEWVSAWKVLCLNDQAYNCLIHFRDNSTVSQCTVLVQTQHKQCTQHSQESNRYEGTSEGNAVSCCQVMTGKEVLAGGSALQSLAFRRSTC